MDHPAPPSPLHRLTRRPASAAVHRPRAGCHPGARPGHVQARQRLRLGRAAARCGARGSGISRSPAVCHPRPVLSDSTLGLLCHIGIMNTGKCRMPYARQVSDALCRAHCGLARTLPEAIAHDSVQGCGCSVVAQQIPAVELSGGTEGRTPEFVHVDVIMCIFVPSCGGH